MSFGYLRQSAALIISGATIQASHFNNEFNAIQSFADSSSGHNHDGTTGGGAKIPTAGLFGFTSSTAGIVAATGSNTWAARTITAPAAGITITNGSGAAGNPTLALANDLAAVEGLATTGIAIRSAADTWLTRTITAGSNIAVSFGDGVSGNPTIALTGIGTTIQGYDATLAALAGYNTNGILVQTAADTFAGRTIAGTTNKITVTNGDGVAGDPTITIATGYVGQASITTTGTLTSGATGAGFTLALGTSTITGILAPANGGTGVDNTGKTITLGGNIVTAGALTTAAAFTTAGAFGLTLTATALTNVTLPTTGTLATLAGAETLTNKALVDSTTTFVDEADATKKLAFQLSGITTGTTRTVTIPDKSGTLAMTSDIVSGITLMARRTPTGVTTDQQTGIPSTAKRVTINFVGLTKGGTGDFAMQIGPSGGVATSGYSAVGVRGGASAVSYTTLFGAGVSWSSGAISGTIVLNLQDAATNTWACSGMFAVPALPNVSWVTGSISLSGALERILLTDSGGSPGNFTSGSWQVTYE